MRDVSQHELTPHGWQFGDAYLQDWLWANDDRKNVDWFIRGRGYTPFALWVVFERKSTADPATRPRRFSLLHVGGNTCDLFIADIAFEYVWSIPAVLRTVVSSLRPGMEYYTWLNTYQPLLPN